MTRWDEIKLRVESIRDELVKTKDSEQLKALEPELLYYVQLSRMFRYLQDFDISQLELKETEIRLQETATRIDLMEKEKE